MGYSIRLIDKYIDFTCLSLKLIVVFCIKNKINLMLLKKLCKINKDMFGKKVINAIDNCKNIL
jgi:hypothetical protein